MHTHSFETRRKKTPSIFIMENILNGQRLLSCTFERRKPQWAPLVDELAHFFAGDVQFAHLYTHKPLVNQALKGQLDWSASQFKPTFRLRDLHSHILTDAYCMHTQHFATVFMLSQYNSWDALLLPRTTNHGTVITALKSLTYTHTNTHVPARYVKYVKTANILKYLPDTHLPPRFSQRQIWGVASNKFCHTHTLCNNWQWERVSDTLSHYFSTILFISFYYYL